MHSSPGIRFCVWLVRKWYFSLPVFGVSYGAFYLLALREHDLSLMQTLRFLLSTALLTTGIFGGLMILFDAALWVAKRRRR